MRYCKDKQINDLVLSLIRSLWRVAACNVPPVALPALQVFSGYMVAT